MYRLKYQKIHVLHIEHDPSPTDPSRLRIHPPRTGEISKLYEIKDIPGMMEMSTIPGILVTPGTFIVPAILNLEEEYHIIFGLNDENCNAVYASNKYNGPLGLITNITGLKFGEKGKPKPAVIKIIRSGTFYIIKAYCPDTGKTL